MTKTIGRYEIREELGRGGMATVFLAYDSRLDRQVAIKLMDQQLAADRTFAARFEREARTVAGLEHNAIVPLYDFGQADSWLYLVMRYMEGGTLKERIANGPLPAGQIDKVIGRIGAALDKAHGQGITHRDLKPANILLDKEGEPYLSDFGIVKVAGGDTEYLTETGQTVGTFAYMSPEQVVGEEELNGRSDIYALGIVLYEMLTGKHPYSEAITTGAMVAAHIQKPVPDVTQDNPAVTAAQAAIVKKAVAKDPSERYASGREMAQALNQVLVGKPTTAEATRTAVTGAEAVTGRRPPARKPQTEKPTTLTSAEEPALQEPLAQKRDIPKWALAVIGFVVVIGIALLLGGLGVFGPDATPTPERLVLTEEVAEKPTEEAPEEPTEETVEEEPELDEFNIYAGIGESGFETTASGLQYAILEQGDGEQLQQGQVVSVHYTGWLEDGTLFDSSVDRGQPFTFAIGQGGVIPGWEEGIALLGIGDIARFIIPDELGYGEKGAGDLIPPNATLIFDIEVLGAGDDGNVDAGTFQGLGLATGSSDGTARLWDATTGEEVAILRGHEDWVWPVVYSPNGGATGHGG